MGLYIYIYPFTNILYGSKAHDLFTNTIKHFNVMSIRYPKESYGTLKKIKFKIDNSTVKSIAKHGHLVIHSIEQEVGGQVSKPQDRVAALHHQPEP